MTFVRFGPFKATAEVISSIRNWVCPECGGRMGGPGMEFQCQGRCQTDWRQVWHSIGHLYRPAISDRFDTL
jgi:hypothetical protein